MTEYQLKFLTAILSILAFLVSIYIYFIRPIYFKSKIKLIIGKYDNHRFRFRVKKMEKINIFYAFDKTTNEHPIVYMPISLRNDTRLVRTDIVVRVDFPIIFKMPNTIFTINKSKINIHGIDETSVPPNIEYKEIGDIVQITYKLDKLRIGESALFSIDLRAEPVPIQKQKRMGDDVLSIENYTTRYSKVKNYISAMPINISVFSQDFDHIEKQINLITVFSNNEMEFETVLNEMIVASWGDYFPLQGIRFSSPLRILLPKPYNIRKHYKIEYSEVCFSKVGLSDLIIKDKSKIINDIRKSKSLKLIVKMPHWGFFGNRFDLAKAGFKTKITKTPENDLNP